MFKRIYFFFFTYLAVTGYAQTLIFLWFLKHDVSYVGMLVYALFNFSAPIVIYHFLNGKAFNSRTSLRLGVFSSGLAVFVASIMTHSWEAYIVGALFGFTNVFFWTIYNALYFKYGVKEEHGYDSGLYFLLFSLTGAVTAPLSGLVAEKLGYFFLFTSGLLFYLVPFFLVASLPSFEFTFKTKKALADIENKILIFFQGCNSLLGMSLIPIVTLFFITTPFKLGNFFGYLALLAALVAVFNSKISDKARKRTSFFYFFTVVNVLSFIPIAFSHSILLWQIFVGINVITSNFSDPFDVAVVLDHAKLEIETTMLGREMYLNAGRVFMLLLALAILYFTHSFNNVLVASALVALCYPLAAFYKKVYLQ